MLFADRHGGELRFVAAWGKWFRYDGTRWASDETYNVFSLVRKLCREMALLTSSIKQANAIASAKTVAAVERLARADRRIAATTKQWDADPMLLNTPGGVVDLGTGKLRKHRADDFMTKITSVTPGGKCPRFERFLKRIFAGDTELIKFMQRVLGYGLTGKTNEHGLFFAYGTGANGKSVLFATARGIFGDYHQTAALTTFTASRTEQHPTDLAMLRGARLVTCTETEEGSRWAELKIKALTGGDAIMARFMRQDFFEFIPQFKLMISGNHKPQLRAVNEAIKRRMNLIPFAVTIPPRERDLHLTDKLEKEWPGILAFMIKGCLAWQRMGLQPPKAVVDATNNYMDDEDVVGQFIADECQLGANFIADRNDLYSKWKTWSDENNVWTGPAKTFYGRMEERGFTSGRDPTGDVRVFKGLQLNPLPTDPAQRKATLFKQYGEQCGPKVRRVL